MMLETTPENLKLIAKLFWIHSDILKNRQIFNTNKEF